MLSRPLSVPILPKCIPAPPFLKKMPYISYGEVRNIILFYNASVSSLYYIICLIIIFYPNRNSVLSLYQISYHTHGTTLTDFVLDSNRGDSFTFSK
jgi:hypothetical protein